MRAGAVIAAMALVVGVAGCGEQRTADHRSAAAARSSLSPTTLRKANCRDWRAATVAERRHAVRIFSVYFGQNLPAGAPAQTLPDAAAYALFQRVCAHALARDFMLWGAYVQAAGFRGYPQAYAAALRALERADR